MRVLVEAGFPSLENRSDAEGEFVCVFLVSGRRLEELLVDPVGSPDREHALGQRTRSSVQIGDGLGQASVCVRRSVFLFVRDHLAVEVEHRRSDFVEYAALGLFVSGVGCARFVGLTPVVHRHDDEHRVAVVKYQKDAEKYASEHPAEVSEDARQHR